MLGAALEMDDYRSSISPHRRSQVLTNEMRLDRENNLFLIVPPKSLEAYKKFMPLMDFKIELS